MGVMDLCNANTTLIIAPRLYHYVKKFQFIEMIGGMLLETNKKTDFSILVMLVSCMKCEVGTQKYLFLICKVLFPMVC